MAHGKDLVGERIRRIFPPTQAVGGDSFATSSICTSLQ